MSLTAISFYRGGQLDDVVPLARKMKALLGQHGANYRLSRLPEGVDLGDWVVTVQYADRSAHDRTLAELAANPEHGRIVADITKLATFVRREMAEDIDL